MEKMHFHLFQSGSKDKFLPQIMVMQLSN